MKIAIIGYGYVGKAVGAFFKDHFDILIYNPVFQNSVTKNELIHVILP